uniref:Putative secreted protein n=1 Tax=Amblyomma cajennense TaxID=34607 RepID=A0A023FB29_AMBCJ
MLTLFLHKFLLKLCALISYISGCATNRSYKKSCRLFASWCIFFIKRCLYENLGFGHCTLWSKQFAFR